MFSDKEEKQIIPFIVLEHQVVLLLQMNIHIYIYVGAQWLINLEIPVLVQSLKSSNVELG